MSKYYDKSVIGIDVASEFSVATILAPNGDVFKKAFKFNHNISGFKYFLEEIKKVENEFSMKPAIFMESTGIYHLTLFYFLLKNKYEAFIINPLITNSNKNKDIRKVKNDKKDSLNIAKLAKYEDIKAYSYFDISIFSLKSLCRDYYKLIDIRTTFKLKLNSDLKMIFPGYNKIFSDKTSLASLALLKKYQSPSDILKATKEDIIEIIYTASKKRAWSHQIYDKLLKSASEAVEIAIPSPALSVRILNSISMIESLNEQIRILSNEIEKLANSDEVSTTFKNNIKLIMSLKGIGFISTITLLSEIGDFNNFKNPKQLVAYFGIDPSVNESGKFKGDRSKMSKRGSRIARRVLYTISLTAIRKKPNGEFSNKNLYDYYHKLIETKKKKVAIVAVIHKIIKYMFAVLRDQKEYECRNPKIHCKMFLGNNSKSAV